MNICMKPMISISVLCMSGCATSDQAVVAVVRAELQQQSLDRMSARQDAFEQSLSTRDRLLIQDARLDTLAAMQARSYQSYAAQESAGELMIRDEGPEPQAVLVYMHNTLPDLIEAYYVFENPETGEPVEDLQLLLMPGESRAALCDADDLWRFKRLTKDADDSNKMTRADLAEYLANDQQQQPIDLGRLAWTWGEIPEELKMPILAELIHVDPSGSWVSEEAGFREEFSMSMLDNGGVLVELTSGPSWEFEPSNFEPNTYQFLRAYHESGTPSYTDVGTGRTMRLSFRFPSGKSISRHLAYDYGLLEIGDREVRLHRDRTWAGDAVLADSLFVDPDWTHWIGSEQGNGTWHTWRPSDRASMPIIEGFSGSLLGSQRPSYRGYNILRLDPTRLATHPGVDPKTTIFEVVRDNSRRWSTYGTEYRIPWAFIMEHVPYAKSNTTTQVFFSERQRNESMNMGITLPVMGFNTSANYSTTKSKLSTSNVVSVMASKWASEYWLILHKQYADLSPGFIHAVNRIPVRSEEIKKAFTTIDEQDSSTTLALLNDDECDKLRVSRGHVILDNLRSFSPVQIQTLSEIATARAYDEFFETYGTHYPLATLYGGLASYERFYEASKVAEALSKSWDVGARRDINVGLEKKGASVSTTLTQELKFGKSEGSSSTEEESYTEGTYTRTGGAGGSFEMWDLAENKNLVPIRVDLRPVYELLLPRLFKQSDTNFADARDMMKNQLDRYLRNAERLNETERAPIQFDLSGLSVVLDQDLDGGAEEWGVKPYGTINLRIEYLGADGTWSTYQSLSQNVYNRAYDGGDMPNWGEDDDLPGLLGYDQRLVIMPAINISESGEIDADYQLERYRVRLWCDLKDADKVTGAESIQIDTTLSLKDVSEAQDRQKVFDATSTTDGFGKVDVNVRVRMSGAINADDLINDLPQPPNYSGRMK